MTNPHPDAYGDPPGTGWRLASWMAFGLAALGAWAVFSAPKQHDMVTAFMTTAVGLVSVFVLGGVGIGCGVFGAVASAAVDDKRFIVMLPVWLNAALVFGLVAYIFAPR